MKNNDIVLQNYNYDMPQELIAQIPADKREESKLIVLNRQSLGISHHSFSDITKMLGANDLLVINTTKVVPARLYGKKKTGGKVELLFLNPAMQGARHRILMKPYVKHGEKIYFDDNYECVVEQTDDPANKTVLFNNDDISSLLEKHGFMPLPPYIKRKDDLAQKLSHLDRERYQTVYANEKGAIAAPTAGLHFTKEILNELKNKKVEIAEITLHVGWGTFKTIEKDDITNHKMLPEKYILDTTNADKINQALESKKRIIAVGTTTVRTLETVAMTSSVYEKNKIVKVMPCSGQTDIFIYPGHTFKLVNSMITNLHLPCSTPLIMASAFAGRDFILKAYKQAVEKKYRFFSYGDSMFII